MKDKKLRKMLGVHGSEEHLCACSVGTENAWQGEIPMIWKRIEKLENSANGSLEAIIQLCLERFDDKRLNSIVSSLKEFIQSKDIQRIEFIKPESEGGSCWDLQIRKM